MQRALCARIINAQSCHGFGCGHTPSKHQNFLLITRFSRKIHFKIADPQNIGHRFLSLSSSFKPVAALTLSLKFLRFSRAESDSRKSSQIGFQENGDVNRGGSGDVEDVQSVDMSNLIGVNADGASEGNVGMIRSVEHMSRPLIHNFAKLSSFWKKENVDRETLKPAETESATSLIECCQFIPPSYGCHTCGARCTSESEINAASTQVTPHTKIARDKEYFSRFLYRVPSSERKRITEMALLSNLAYRIPTIEV